MSFGATRPAFAAAARPPSPNAFIISVPPAAWQFTIEAPVAAAAAAARPTVFGMSCSLRSRKTPAPDATISRTREGPSATKASSPTFRTPTSGPMPCAMARSAARFGRSSATARRARASRKFVIRPRARAERVDEIGHARDAVVLAPRGKLADETVREGRRPEVRGANLDGVRARDEELDDVLDGLDPAHPEDRDFRNGLAHLPHHAQRDGADRGSRKPAGRETDLRLTALEIDREADERIDQRKRVGPGVDGRVRQRDDVRHVRREFDDERMAGGRADPLHEGGERLGVVPEDHASLDHVRAGDVHLDRGHASIAANALHDRYVLVLVVPPYVRDHGRAEAGELGQLLGEKRVDAHVLKTDRVQHSRVRLADARGRVAVARTEREALHGDRAERREVEVMGELEAVAEGAGCRSDRVLQAQPAKGRGEVDRHG